MLPKLQPQKEIHVDGQKYVVQLYPPTVGFMLYAKLLRLLGESLFKLIGSFDKAAFTAAIKSGDSSKLSMESVDLDMIGSSISGLLSKIGDEEVVPLIKEILQCTFIATGAAGMPVNDQFETLFMGRYNHVLKLVAKTVGAQYPDFLSVLGKRASAVKLASGSEPTKAGP